MKRIISLLLTAALTAALLAYPAAAAAPWVQVEGHTVTLRGVSGSVDGVQVTLNLNQAAAFQFDESLDNSATHTAQTSVGNALTLYIASRDQLNLGDSILLGQLAGEGETAVISVTGLKLLDMDRADGESSYSSVSMTPPSTGGSGGSGNWGGSGGSGSSGTGSPGTGSSGTGSPGTGSSGTSTDSPAVLPFTDVGASAWYRDAVSYVYQKGLMTGATPTSFSPSMTTSRAMIVTILYRYEGSPAAGAPGFADVAPGQYYTDAVAWAARSGVVNGYSASQFAPNDPITREQMAAILFRYAEYKGLDVSSRASLSAYADSGQISAYARDAMAWANRAGLITGVDARTLQPRGSATRAQVATILARFCQSLEA